MTKQLLRGSLLAAFAILPQLLAAQWSLVRFDEYNFYNRIVTKTADAAIATGLDPTGLGSFILRTNNAGVTWDSIAINGSGGVFNLSQLYFTDVDNGFAGGLKDNFQIVLSTTDNGSTWIDITPDPASIDQINIISFVDPDNGFVSDQTNLFKTTDGGASWTVTQPAFSMRDVKFLNMNLGYGCGTVNPDAVVMKTTDGGITWNTVLNAMVPGFSSSSMEKLDAISADIVFCSAVYSNVIYRTINGGNSWDTLYLPQIYSVQDYDFISANEGHVLSTMGEIYGTVDGGVTWTLEYAVAGGAYGPSIYLVSVSFEGATGFVCGSDGLIKKYTNDPTGIQETATRYTVSPNPLSSGNVLTIRGVFSSYGVEIFNTNGQLIFKQDDMSGTGFMSPRLSSGIYSIVITNSSGSSRQKLVVVD